MPIGARSRVGPYEITALLGEGGMGKVWRAHHVALKRDDALKILPERFASDPERLARFQREAQMLAALNHPNIAHLYGLESAEGLQAIVMELVEGPTLADRLAAGPLPLDEALAIARQIAEALEAAHEQNIIHRDLKPANIKVRRDGTVKLLDFGVAKALRPDRPGADGNADPASPTVTRPLTTEAGVVYGTAAYMSPEQARGHPTDRRADIWAFGCVVFEMLSGQRAFAGHTGADTLVAVLRSEPDWQTLPANLPPRIRLMLERCLEKNPKDRYQGIADARIDIDYALRNPHDPAMTFPAATATTSARRLAKWLTAAAVVAAVAGAVAWRIKPSVSQPDARLSIVLPPGQTFTAVRHPVVAVAPDGSAIVYVANNQLFRRAMNELDAQAIRGTQGTPSTPFFSPDGQTVGYWDARDGRLKKIAVGGGTAIALAQATLVRGASWGRDGSILYATPEGIWSVPSSGGEAKRIVPVEEALVHGPQMLPDGKSVLFTRLAKASGQSWEGSEIVVADFASGQLQTILPGEDARYVPTGHLVYANDTSLFAVRFDPSARRVAGGPVPIAEGVLREVWVAGNTATANYGFTDGGVLVYVDGPAKRFPVILRDLVLVDHKGIARSVTDQRRDYWRPVISPDGKRAAVEVFDGQGQQIWIVELDTGRSTQFTFDRFQNFAVWAPDGQSVIFNTLGPAGTRLYRKRIDGGTDAEFLGVSGEIVATDVSGDGTLVYSLGEQTAVRAIWTMSLNELRPAEALATPAQEHHAMFSPDDKWLAYVSDASGANEVYVRPYPIVRGTERRVSEGGGLGPVWAPDGSALYFRGAESMMMAATPLGPGFVPGRPQPLFPIRGYRFSGNSSAFDILPDGKRFLMVTMGDAQPPVRPQINVVLNWFDELRRRVN